MVAEPGRTPEQGARTRRRPGPAVGAAGLTLAVLAGLVVLGGSGGEPPVAPRVEAAAAGLPPADPTAAVRLRRADEASRELAWQGTQFVARWSPGGGGSSAVVDVVHVPGRGSLVRAASTPSSVPALVPEQAVRTPTTPLGLLQRHYVLRDGGEGRCAGRVADVVEAWRRDGPAGTLAARFWLDRETGLVLRREVLDPAGRTLLASAFLDLQTPLAGTPAGPVPPTRGQRLEPVDAGVLRGEGWPVPVTLAGLDLHEARAGGEGSDRLVHLAYSDGLLGVSVFAQAGQLDPEALRGWERRRVGAAQVWVADTVPERVAWAAGGTVFTVLADAPGGTLEEAVGALPHDDPGALSDAASALRVRLARGLARVAEWVAPAA